MNNSAVALCVNACQSVSQVREVTWDPAVLLLIKSVIIVHWIMFTVNN